MTAPTSSFKIRVNKNAFQVLYFRSLCKSVCFLSLLYCGYGMKFVSSIYCGFLKSSFKLALRYFLFKANNLFSFLKSAGLFKSQAMYWGTCPLWLLKVIQGSYDMDCLSFQHRDLVVLSFPFTFSSGAICLLDKSKCSLLLRKPRVQMDLNTGPFLSLDHIPLPSICIVQRGQPPTVSGGSSLELKPIVSTHTSSPWG